MLGIARYDGMRNPSSQELEIVEATISMMIED